MNNGFKTTLGNLGSLLTPLNNFFICLLILYDNFIRLNLNFIYKLLFMLSVEHFSLVFMENYLILYEYNN